MKSTEYPEVFGTSGPIKIKLSFLCELWRSSSTFSRLHNAYGLLYVTFWVWKKPDKYGYRFVGFDY